MPLVISLRPPRSELKEYELNSDYTLDEVRDIINTAIERRGTVVLSIKSSATTTPGLEFTPRPGWQILVRDTSV